MNSAHAAAQIVSHIFADILFSILPNSEFSYHLAVVQSKLREKDSNL